MIPRSKSMALGGENVGSGRPKKKPAPPRPPQPSHLKLQNSQSFKSASDIKLFNRSLSIGSADSRPTQNSDLIDFSSSPPKSTTTVLNRTTASSSDEGFMYRVGASVFYIKSPLKNSTSENPSAHPFSPPRPSAQALLSTPTKKNENSGFSFNKSQTTTATTTTQYQNVSMKTTNATIIRSYGATVNSNISASNDPNSVTTQNNNNKYNNEYNTKDANSQQSAQTRYSNVPLTWDEPPKRIVPPAIAPKPTIIRPKPSSNILTSMTSAPPAPPPVNHQETTAQSTRNYYDEPPESEDEDDNYDIDAGESFDSPPMPDEPPPPPPPEIEELDQWVEGTVDADAYYEDGAYAAEGNRAYAIALYDYIPEAEGDLAIQAGDLVYLTKQIDESWLYGFCGGAEGMFPASYVNIVVPLPSEEIQVPEINSTEITEIDAEADAITETTQTSNESSSFYYADVLYQFKAETENDLSLEPGDVVTIWGRINDDWLYGSMNRTQGQFPAVFVHPVPSDLPVINI